MVFPELYRSPGTGVTLPESHSPSSNTLLLTCLGQVLPYCQMLVTHKSPPPTTPCAPRTLAGPASKRKWLTLTPGRPAPAKECSGFSIFCLLEFQDHLLTPQTPPLGDPSSGGPWHVREACLLLAWLRTMFQGISLIQKGRKPTCVGCSDMVRMACNPVRLGC